MLLRHKSRNPPHTYFGNIFAHCVHTQQGRFSVFSSHLSTSVTVTATVVYAEGMITSLTHDNTARVRDMQTNDD